MVASRRWPMARTRIPKTINPMKKPRNIFMTLVSTTPIPNMAAAPPNPIIAEELINVAPYERAIM
ncbi:MAG: hypothetical protein BWY09_00977 [Candidatus Hydrogenedentes bacterium ADurb.Bin179]|nr:MAG: hypothetical protein BWY09_00977 [Candidatus Hydrogenedentes bacterium ADurb.Bin179]